MAPRETEDNAYAKFWGDKQRALWYVMVFLEWSIKSTHDYFVSIQKATKDTRQNVPIKILQTRLHYKQLTYFCHFWV